MRLLLVKSINIEKKLLFLGIFNRKKRKSESQMSYKALSSCSVYVTLGEYK